MEILTRKVRGITRLFPTDDELNRHKVETFQHMSRVEYFALHCKAGLSDNQRPHDMNGENHKLTLPISSRIALQNRKGLTYYNYLRYIKPAINQHRRQNHHLPREASGISYDIVFRTIDTVCAYLESRCYNRSHTYKEIIEVAKSCPSRGCFDLETIYNMMDLEQPHIEAIVSLGEMPNIGIPDEIYQKAIKAIETATKEEIEHGCHLSKLE